jgi:hypothetical protein
MAYEAEQPPYGYHKSRIEKGVFGEISKIQEEVLELKDAMKQECKIMALMELSDLYGAIRGFMKINFPTYTMSDLEKMSDITERVFTNGFRK